MKKKYFFVGGVLLVLLLLGGGIFFSYKSSFEEKKILSELQGKPELLKTYDRVKELEKKNKENNSSDIAGLINLGFEWKSLGDATENPFYYKKALEVYKIGIKNFGDKNVPFYWNAGKVAQTLQDYSLAEFYFREAIRIAPSYNESYLYLAELYEYKMKKPDTEVLKVLGEGLTITRGDASLYLEQCSFLRRHNRTKDALDCYQNLLLNFPNNQGYKETVEELKKLLNK